MAESLEGEPTDEMKVAENEIRQKERELYNIGLSDGLNRGYEEQFQLGFNEGFKEGDAFGKCLGIINASIKILDLCFKNPSVESDIRDSFEGWKRDIEGYLVPPQLVLKQSEYDTLKAERLGVIITRIKDMFAALKMQDCVLMKLLQTISI
ncbi:hypothetical protein WA171_006004 [Blastocystis sp. BT1]